MEKYLRGLTRNPNKITSMEDLIEYTKTHFLEDFPTFDVDIFQDAASAERSDHPKYQAQRLNQKHYLED